MSSPSNPATDDRAWRRAAWIAAALLLLLMLWMSRDFGVTWDEIHRQANGERIWGLYQGIAQRSGPDSGNLYGGLFDVLAVACQRVVALDQYDVRHLLNAAFGWLGIVCTGLIGTRVAGPRAGLLAMALLAASPAYIGHAMNNPKDLPFAALATAVLAVLARLPQGRPYVRWPDAIVLGVAIGATLAVRPGGLLFLGYAGLWVAAALVAGRERDGKMLAWVALAMLVVTAVAVVSPMPVWPFLWERPVVGILEAVDGVSQFEWSGTVLFMGRDVPADAVPWTYVPVWLIWTTPPVVLAGAVLSLRACAGPAGWRRRAAAGLWFAVLFPVVYVVARHSTLYDGIRHLLFIVPPLVALAALGWDGLLRAVAGPRRAAVAAVLAVGIAEPVIFQVRNHPNQVVYFQPLVGGPWGAWTEFELDYWGNCLYQAVREAGELGIAAGQPVVISGRQDRLLLLNSSRVPSVAVVPPGRRAHELEIFLMRGRRASLRAFSQRGDVLWRVATADGAPLCAVVPGPQFERLRRALEARGAAHLLRR
jgi:hypothetical protein